MHSAGTEDIDDDIVERQIRALFAVAEALHDPENRDLRRAPRQCVDIPVWIYGYRADGEPFYAEARALDVSKTGALLLVNVTLSCGDQILIANKKKSKELRATVTRFGGRREGWEEVGVTFEPPNERIATHWNTSRAGGRSSHKPVNPRGAKKWKRERAR